MPRNEKDIACNKDYDVLIGLPKSRLIELAKFWDVPTCGTKHDIAERIANIDIYD